MNSENPEQIVRRHYATDEHLRIRQETHARYTVPDRSFVEWVLDRVDWRGDETVLDVGCGTGLYYDKLAEYHPDLRYVGMDLIGGMLRGHSGYNNEKSLLQGDAQQLPFATASFDVVMANHMLYHVENVEIAVAELARVLRPDGILIVAANSINTMPEMQVLMRRAIVLLTRGGAAQVRAPELPSDRFALENGTRVLSRYFYAVVRHDLPSALVFPEVEPAMAYLESTRDLREASLPADVVWEDVMMIMRQQINQLVKHLGELVISKQAGVLIASERGGFIQQFTRIKSGESV
ncbi:MAG: class I SAM-dependent methyltransferase [Anaerolineae bacterium]|nr:class I SAM-dependent methyltransferase [Anaerolineae bacterium]